MAKCKGNELLHRMNFLSQVQDVLNQDAPQQTDLNCYYGHTLHIMSRRTQTKMHSSFKQNMCKKCSIKFKEGVNCSVKVRSKGRGRTIEIHCKVCQTVRRVGTGARQSKHGVLKKKSSKVEDAAMDVDETADLVVSGSVSKKRNVSGDSRRRCRRKKRRLKKKPDSVDQSAQRIS